jgi:hypothetical protein
MIIVSRLGKKGHIRIKYAPYRVRVLIARGICGLYCGLDVETSPHVNATKTIIRPLQFPIFNGEQQQGQYHWQTLESPATASALVFI